MMTVLTVLAKGGLGPGDAVGRDGSVDHAVVGESTAIEGHTQGSRSISVGKERRLYPPSRMDT